jgi:uncharacterized protein (DUF983 family)
MAERRVLASLDGIATVMALMVGSGVICHECGHGTRATSKRWAKCKACGARVPRRPMEDVAKELRGDEVRVGGGQP